MKIETIIYKGKRYNRYPQAKLRQHRVYYWRHSGGDKTPISLHRQIWIDNFGLIKKGFHIHHKDENPLNNKANNLECISASVHASFHGNKPERRKYMKMIQRLGQSSAKMWHKSKEGKRWHQFHAQSSIFGQEVKRICVECNSFYKTRVKMETKYCSKKCKARCNSRQFRKKNPDYYRVD